MKITYNKKALMAYAHFLVKRGWSMSDALKSAWEAAKYIVAWDIIGLKKTTYTSSYPLVIADGVSWHTDDRNEFQRWLDKYGAE